MHIRLLNVEKFNMNEQYLGYYFCLAHEDGLKFQLPLKLDDENVLHS